MIPAESEDDEEEDPLPPASRPADSERDEDQAVVSAAVNAWRASENASAGGQAPSPVRSMDKLKEDDLEQDIKLKKFYAQMTLIGVGVQVAIVDVAFFIYLFFGRAKLSPIVMDIWVGATVVEVIGVILVIARYLFPRRDE